MQINTNRLNKIRYTAYASGYNIAGKYLDKSRQRSISLLDVRKGEKVLIVGAGTGLDLDYLPKDCAITATDITPAMVRQIEKRNARLKRNVSALVMDGHELAFPDASFDKVILHVILAVIPDPVKAFDEAERVLKPGGLMTIYDKFVPKGQKPSILRRLFNPFTNLMFSNITRTFESISINSNLQIVQEEDADLGGAFRIILLEKDQ